MIVPIKGGGAVLENGSPEALMRIDQRLDELRLEYKDCSPLLIVSALAGMTDQLEEVWRVAVDRSYFDAKRLLEDIFESHHSIGLELLQYRGADEAQKLNLIKKIAELRKRAYGTLEMLLPDKMNTEATFNRAKAALMSYGERLAAIIVTAWAELTHMVLRLDAATLVRLSSSGTHRYTDMSIDWNPSINSLQEQAGLISQTVIEARAPTSTVLWLMEGFIGSAESGFVGTLPREGSDWSEILAAAAFGSPAYFLKVLESGLYSMPLGELLPYQERLGSHMIGPEAIHAALEHRIPLVVTNANTGERYYFKP